MSGKKSEQVQTHILDRFTILKKVGSGAYGHVWKVQEKQTQKVFALKKIFDAFQHSTDAQRTYREIQILQQIDHPGIVKLYQTMPAENNRDVYLLFQFMESDLHNAIGDNILKDAHFKFITYQIGKALKYLHSGLIIHRDLKPSNILVNSDCSVKLCDFGLVRSLINANQNNPVLTEGVATRWYRAPQVLLGSKCYSTPADIWSFGCIIYEAITRKPLFPGRSTLDQLQKILTFTGSPSDQDIDSLESQVFRTMVKQIKPSSVSNSSNIMKTIPALFQDLISKMIVFNPKKRITIDELLRHPTLKSFRKQQEQIVSDKNFKTSIDDNKKLSVDEYRKIIYGDKKNIRKPSIPQLSTNQEPNKKQLKNIQNKVYENINPIYKNTLGRINSCQSINEIQNTPKNNDSQKQPQIRNSWKHIINSPEQALRHSGNFLAKPSKFITKSSNQKSAIEKSEILNSAQIRSPINEAKNQFIQKSGFLNSKNSSIGSVFWNAPKTNSIKIMHVSPKNVFLKKIT